jgi:anti-sigma factor (TIGR02949 family)
MTRCSDIEPLLAPYVDGEADPAGRAAVEAHLDACPPCRDRIGGERAAREVLRECRASLVRAAPETLRRRCASCLPAPPGARRWVPLSLAATLVLAVAGVFIYGSFDSGASALATQLAADHVKCFTLPPAGPADATAIAREWEARQGWRLTVPPSWPTDALELIGVRRCLSSAGRTAHLMYRHHGRPLSLFVAREEARRPRVLEVLGHETIIWSQGDRTFVLVAREERDEVERVAAYVRSRQ